MFLLQRCAARIDAGSRAQLIVQYNLFRSHSHIPDASGRRPLASFLRETAPDEFATNSYHRYAEWLAMNLSPWCRKDPLRPQHPIAEIDLPVPTPARRMGIRRCHGSGRVSAWGQSMGGCHRAAPSRRER